jgi:mono/diheme cytochrome c family protein
MNNTVMAQFMVIAAMLMAGRNTSAASKSMVPQDPAIPTNAKNTLVSPVKGESWLSHLNRSFGDTSMGKTWHLGPPPSGSEKELPSGQAEILIGCTTQVITLRGADLYRLNCRGCHGEAGLGAPPEINSIIDPVRATSVQLVQDRMQKIGASVSAAQATQLAQQAQAALLQRLHDGGKSMPPFSQLNEAEVRSILAYLRQLAGFPEAENEQIAVSEPPVRVGELIVKSTCHICHSAAGPDPSPEELLNGAIPPLQTLTARKNQSGLVEKVTEGAPVLMGKPPMLFRGKMPVFYYLTPDEAADVYSYLTLYPPPSEFAILTSAATTLRPTGTPTGHDHTELIRDRRAERWSELPSRESHAETQHIALVFGAGLLAASLTLGGLGFTLWEFKRLASKNKQHILAARDVRIDPGMARSLFAAKQGLCRTSFLGWNKRRRREEPFKDEAGELTKENTTGGRQCRDVHLG